MNAAGTPPSQEGPRAFGALLQRHRLAAGLSQAELAERAGLSQRGISDLERGLRHAPYLATVRRLAEALDLHEPERVRLLAISRGADLAPPPPAAEPLAEAPPAGRRDATLPAASRPDHGLPRLFTSFIGRERDLLHLQRQLGSNVVLTLTGPGGVGKTRLAIHLANEVQQEYRDGTWFVELGGLGDGQLVPQAIAHALGVVEHADRRLADFRRTRHLTRPPPARKSSMELATWRRCAATMPRHAPC